MAEDYAKIVKGKVEKVVPLLQDVYEGELEAQRTLDYGMKYTLKIKGEACGVVNCFYSPKKKRFTVYLEKGASSLKPVVDFIQQELGKKQDSKDSFQQEQTKIKSNLAKEELIYYYETLKPYRTQNIDFQMFVVKLKTYAGEKKIELKVKDDASFDQLEEIYRFLIDEMAR
nr:hypothetical protein [uncultured Niameybacter sp.]